MAISTRLLDQPWPGLSLRYVALTHLAVVVKTKGIPSRGRCTNHFRTYFSGDWGVLDFDFDPRPFVLPLQLRVFFGVSPSWPFSQPSYL